MFYPAIKRHNPLLTWDFQQQEVQPSRMKSVNPLLCISSFMLARLDKVVQHSHESVRREVVFRKKDPDILRPNTRATVRNPVMT